MNHYDDLQRFKDKIAASGLDFKNLSTQSEIYERGDWALINQVRASESPDPDPGLATAGSVSETVLAPVEPDTFAWAPTPINTRLAAAARKQAGPVNLGKGPNSVTAPPGSQRLSLIDSISASISEPEPSAPPRSAPTPVNLPRPALVDVPLRPVPAPAAPVLSRPAPPAARATTNGFSRLFATKTPDSDSIADKSKEQPLKSLLERMSTCR